MGSTKEPKLIYFISECDLSSDDEQFLIFIVIFLSLIVK